MNKFDNTAFEEDLYIDPTALDLEDLEQPELAYYYSIKVAAYLSDRARRKHEQVKTIRSELIHAVNIDPVGTTNKKSPNAGDIEAYYRRDARYQRAKTDSLDAQYEADQGERAAGIIQFQRSESLKQLNDKLKHGYIAGPSIPRNLEREQKLKETK